MAVAVVLVNVSVLSGFFPLLAAWYNYRRLDQVLKLMVAFCLVSVLPDLAGLITLYLKLKYNNLFLMHLFDLVAVVFFTLIYYHAFYKPVLKKVTLILGGITFLIMIGNEIFIESIKDYPSVCNTILCLLLIPLSLIYFYQIFSRQEFTHIEKQGMFWINAGVLIYFSINVFLFMLYNKISSVEKQDFYMMQSITNIIANLLYSVGLLCKPQKTT
ncbi:MAG: hypothetical protein JWP78_2957 [Mucilaginibacter sp.]|jgi:heme A synthase|nr:hypothetical protein [Mucilaginibacter sp.]